MRNRLDGELVARGLVATRSRARDLVRRGLVRVDGAINCKPALGVDAAMHIEVITDAGADVSRGAEKLRHALCEFEFDATGRICLDLGASTGGFTQVLLANGASRVFAVDVGSGQLHENIRGDTRVINMEQTDVRSLNGNSVQTAITAMTADLSFISLRKALPAALCLASPGCWLVALIKPQFELSPDLIGKGGIVRNEDHRAQAVLHVRSWLEARDGWNVVGCVDSPITGGSGNHEFLLGAVRND